MGRARDTARATEEASGLKAEVLEWCRELTYWPHLPGEAKPGEGALALWDISGEAVRSVRDVSACNEFEKIPLIAEAKKYYDELCKSSDEFLTQLGYERQEDGAYKIVHRNRDTIALFCHGGFGLTWMAHLLGLPLAATWSSFYLAPSSVTTVLFDERSQNRAVPRAISVSDTSHMYSAGLTTINNKYEKPNQFTAQPRPSGVKSNFF
jgi:hypothetical protein